MSTPMATVAMPTFTVAREPLDEVATDVLVVFARKGERADGQSRAVATGDAVKVGGLLGVELDEQLDTLRFDGELGAVARFPTQGRLPARLVFVLGLGKATDDELEALRKAAGTAARQAMKDATVAIVVPGDVAAGATAAERTLAVVEGAGLGSYTYNEYRSKTHDVPSLREVRIVAGEGVSADALEPGLRDAVALVLSTSLARDFGNTPPAAKRPPVLADRFAEVARAAGLAVRVFDEQALAEGGFGGILGVGQGSSMPPRLVELTYDPPEARGHVVLVGKGITFDSGGLSLKPSNSMQTMKSDMSGAGAVVGAMTALRHFQVAIKVTGLAALAENMPSGHAIRVSDVLTHRGGKTVEVMNTDAEGRLVLADAIAYAAEQKPDAIVDVATLTGAQVVALGTKIAAVMGSDDGLVEELRAAAQVAGEQVWPLPLPPEYADQLKSQVADLKNIGKQGQAGSIVAGLFLKEFTDDIPWAHLDIAGPAFTEDGDSFYTPKGATGAGVRLLVRFLQQRGAA